MTYNCQSMIRKTILSVIEQSFKNVEYLIIDGKSTDETYSIVLRYAEKNKSIKSISETDKGIYNAMNKALKYVSGDYVLFLNAGDYFYSKDILKHFAEYIIKFNRPDIIYGNAVFYVGQNIIMTEKKNFNWKLILKANGVCHQSVLAKAELFKEYQFEESFIYCADRDWLYYMYFKKRKFVHMDEKVVYYEATGFSSQKRVQRDVTKEIFQIQKKYGIHLYYISILVRALMEIKNLLSGKHKLYVL